MMYNNACDSVRFMDDKMKDRSIQIRNYILDLLESGKLQGGEKLPGARKIAEDLNCSFTQVQGVVESLVQCGVLKAVPRSGTYVDEEWTRRILPCNFVAYQNLRRGILQDVIRMSGEKSGLRGCRRFHRGAVEIRVSHYLLSHHDEYLDLTDVFHECFGDGRDFYMHVLKDFHINGRLCGLPITFSPRVIYYNVDLFQRFKCPVPRPDWTWDEFLETIRYLKNYMPAPLIFNWESRLPNFNTFLVRAGCDLFRVRSGGGPQFGSEAGIHEFERYVALRDLLETKELDGDLFLENFCDSQAAMMLSTRQLIYFLDKFRKPYRVCAVRLPSFPGGCDVNIQGADILCFRKSCTDRNLVKNLVKRILSAQVQDYIAAANYGIPLRKASAAKTLNPDSCYDSVLIHEIPKISAAYNIFSPVIYNLLMKGCLRIFNLPLDKVAGEVRDLAKAVDVMMKIEQYDNEY